MQSNLTQNLIELEQDKVLSEIKERLQKGEEPLSIISECNEGMEIIGEKYKNKEYFLAELLLSGELFKEAMDLITPHLSGKAEEKSSKGQVLLATIQGDIHDLGKNILATLLKLEGFKVHDLGVDVNPDLIVEKVKEINPDFLGFSALLSLTFDPMKNVIDKLKAEGLRDGMKIMVGGGVTTSLVKDYIDADFQTIDAMEGVEYCLKNVRGA